MKFIIKHIGRVADAEIVLNGITLIVGDNNMGKTTTGRALYAFFNALYRIDNEVETQRTFQITKILRRFFEKYRHPFADPQLLKGYISAFLSNKADEGEKIRNYIEHRLTGRATQPEIVQLMDKIIAVRSLSNTAIRKQIIQEYFDSVFANQCVSFDYKSEGGLVHGIIEGHKVNVEFQSGGVVYDSELNLQHKAYFIDSPDLLNYWGRYRFVGGMGGAMPLTFTIRKAIDDALTTDDSPADRAFDNLLYTERYNKFLDEIAEVIGGHFEFDQNYVLRFVENRVGVEKSPTFDLSNVSEGLKAFGVIELMLKYRVLGDGDVLVFDEPEVHLHPEWQIKYASMLVKLQEEFNLKILITTHSSSFLMALQFVSRVRNRECVVNSYRIKEMQPNSRYSMVVSENPSDWDDAYVSFVKAAQRLEKLREKAYSEEVECDEE